MTQSSNAWTFASLFSGFGLADLGAMAAGWQPVYAIDIDPRIAAVYRDNIGDHIEVGDITQLPILHRTDIDWLHASPVCKSFSLANTNRYEMPADLAVAHAVTRYIAAWRPRVVTIENVPYYRYSQSYRHIARALDEGGYWWVVHVVDAADYGVPQTRRRLIIRARRDGRMIVQLQQGDPIGWYAAVADLVDDLPDAELSPRQCNNLEERVFTYVTPSSSSFLVNGANAIASVYNGKKPAFTMTALKNVHKIVLVNPDQSDADDCARDEEAPSYTVTPRRAGQQRITDGLVVKAVSPRCMARWQTMPDSYRLPKQRRLAYIGIGNGVPCELMRRIGDSLR